MKGGIKDVRALTLTPTDMELKHCQLVSSIEVLQLEILATSNTLKMLNNHPNMRMTAPTNV